MKHFALAAVLTLCLLAAAGCGKKENGKVTETPTPTEELTYLENWDSEIPTPSVPVRDLGGITVTVADWWSDENWNLATTAYGEAFNEMLRDFEKEANFSFERKNAGFGNGEEYAAKIGEAIQADNPPGEVIAVPLSNIGTLLRDGCLLDVTGTESVSFDEYKWKHHNGITDFLSINGKQYGFDWECHEAGLGLFVNKALLEEAGIDPNRMYDIQNMSYRKVNPSGTASKLTWEAFLDICEQLKKAGLGDDVAIAAGQDVQVVYGALLSNGTNVIEKDEQGLLRVNGADTPAVKEALTFAAELKKQGYLVSMSEEESQQAFAEGKAVFLIAEERMAAKVGAGENENIGFVCFTF